MIKLYKRDKDGTLRYHEAWIADREIIEHWGVAGTRGEVRRHKLKSRSQSRQLGDVLHDAIRTGYQPVSFDNHFRLIVEYPVQDMGSPEDLEKRNALMERLNETLGWTGLGHCDGGSIGSRTMEVCCFVIDFAIAKRIVEADLAGNEFADFARIYDEDTTNEPPRVI